jgi:hypothetical protein
MKALINLGVQGHYPLFHDSWINDRSLQQKSFLKITGVERAKAKKLFTNVLKHRNLERKKIVVLSMNEEDRALFIKAFFKLVEGKILDQKQELH